MIPKIIHFVWLGSDVPNWARRNIAEFDRINGDYQIKLHTDDSMLLDELRGAWEACTHPSMQADLLRLSILMREGGWYFDVDYWPLRPLEDAVRAWLLDGTKVLATKQNNRTVPLNNCVLACAPGVEGISAMVQRAAATSAKRRCSFGPDLLSAVASDMPWAFFAPQWPWFLPADHDHAWRFYQYALRGIVDPLRRASNTGDQLPFALHLWLNGKGDEIRRAFETEPDTRPVALVEKVGNDHHMSGIAEGLEAAGYHVERYAKGATGVFRGRPFDPAVVVMWNNIRGREFYEQASKCSQRVLVMEVGFMDRSRYVQLDPKGFLHWSSWASYLQEPAPSHGAERLKTLLGGSEIQPMRKRDGYILVIGQVPGDSQLVDCEIRGPVPLQAAITRAMTGAMKAYFRPHPQCLQRRPNSHHISLPMLETATGEDERSYYARQKQGVGLAEALAGARFVVTINSNAIIDALIAGVPCLAFGPHLGIVAQAVRPTCLKTLREDLAAMWAGWTPRDQAVRNFLEHLACRQYSRDELRRPELVRGLLGSSVAGACND